MASFSDLWDGLNQTAGTAVDAYVKILGAKSDSKSDAQYYKGMNDALVYAQNQKNDRDIIQLGDLSISTSSLLWIIGGTLGLLAIGIGVKKLI